jgi:hypothetical protein
MSWASEPPSCRTLVTADGVLFDSRAWIITAYRAKG